MNLNADQVFALVSLRNATGYAHAVHAELEVMGLVVTGKSRFAEWARLTEAGREYVDRMSARGRRAAPTPGPSASDHPHRSPELVLGLAALPPEPPGGAQRLAKDQNAATQARRDALVIRPPASALDVGAVSFSLEHLMRELTLKVIANGS